MTLRSGRWFVHAVCPVEIYNVIPVLEQGYINRAMSDLLSSLLNCLGRKTDLEMP